MAVVRSRAGKEMRRHEGPGKADAANLADRYLTPDQFPHFAGFALARRCAPSFERSWIVSIGKSSHRGYRSRVRHLSELGRAFTPVVETLENRWLLSAAAGDVDLTLTAGLFGPSSDSVTAVLRQGNKTNVAGESFGSGDAFLARFDPAGNLDATFGVAGRTNIHFGGPSIIHAPPPAPTGKTLPAAGSSSAPAI